MLDYIRTNAQSWGVKAAFGIIILVFVFWGVGSLRDSNTSGVIAKVNGVGILGMDFAQNMRQAEESIRRNSPGITSEQLKQMQLGRQVLQQMIIENLLQQEAARLDITVSPLQLRQAIAQIPVFQNEQGQFDPEAYKRVLAAQRQNMGRFEENIRKGLLEQNLRRDVSAAAWISPEDARAFFNFAQEKRDVEYVFFPASDFAQSEPAEDALKAWYESNRQAFAIPARVDVEYILARPADLIKQDAISAEAVKTWYEHNQSRFGVPARAQVRHILLRLEPKASAEDVQKVAARMESIVAELKKGGDFAALAAKYSEDEMTAAKGGELGWIKQGDTVPPFNDAAFALQPGKVSAPVRTDFGMHLIQLEAKEDAKVAPLAEVEGDIRKTLAEQQGAEKIREVMDTLIEANILGKPLAEAAAPLGLSVKQSGLLSAFELQKALSLKDKETQLLMNTPAGSPIDTALEAGDNGFVVVRVKNAVPASTRPYEEVKGEIAVTLKERQARVDALKAATDVRKAMSGNALPPALAAKAKQVAEVGRGDSLPVLGQQPEMLAALFNAAPAEWLPAAYAAEVEGAPGAVLVRPTKISLPDGEEWGQLEGLIRSSLESQRKNQMFQAFVNILLSKAKVEITNPAFLKELEQM